MITEPVQLPLPFLPGLLAHHRAVLVEVASGSWQRRAACRDGRPDDWFPEDEQDGSAAFEPRRVCGGCPVARQCLSWALLADEQGIWGGTTGTERDAILADLGSGLPLGRVPATEALAA
ncbi:WhiB family transcriptional regulator [Microlunatus parietis]|uniref:4Fe-4S Wbl-type domain-containing protein n=1 Tax=Microlunatus parietis TaxID=682979 RepID=A0A7Y9I7Y2_9ACTN|nr:WhiB family transcriptional regulator [Microlunatus parietis]NYE71710.1 hypothetical protein [Microlunatus parietis]